MNEKIWKKNQKQNQSKERVRLERLRLLERVRQRDCSDIRHKSQRAGGTESAEDSSTSEKRGSIKTDHSFLSKFPAQKKCPGAERKKRVKAKKMTEGIQMVENPFKKKLAIKPKRQRKEYRKIKNTPIIIADSPQSRWNKKGQEYYGIDRQVQ